MSGGCDSKLILMVDDKVAGILKELKGLKVVERMVSAPIDLHSCKPGLGKQVRTDRPEEVTLQ